eukprot:TRINITY_DN917_c0_g2_i1.p1 TRINITY_DN917_c0_g2~~TRINITY_DN917_c0_g2_i1.p1  ORF type:complete len:320 (+),score=61.19 TRINITY_DN917_c0_g2_i1:90-1049(+)
MRMTESVAAPATPQLIRVFDPVNKQPYEFVYGGESSEVTYTAGLETYFNQLGGNKRVFLCKKYQARQCRAQGKCNSIHADRRKVARLRDLNPVVESEQLDIDVYCKEDNVTYVIPFERIRHGPGRDKIKTEGRAALCSKEGCLGCAEAHVDPSYMKHVRVMYRAPCCGQAACNGGEAVTQTYPALGGVKEIRVFRVGDGEKNAVLPKVMLAVTRGLHQLCSESAQPRSGCVHIPMLRVCRPHFKRNCKWGADCNNVHICRKRQPKQYNSPHLDASSTASSTETEGVECDATHTEDDARVLTQLTLMFRNSAIPTGGVYK